MTAFLDASVLYPALLRDVLMRLALHGLFQARWSPRVQDEWSSSLLRDRPDLSPGQIDHVRRLMDVHMPDASITGFEGRIEELELPDPDDRHVLAAAIHSQAQVIVTANLRDFPAAVLARFGLEATHPDVFIADLARKEKTAAFAAMRRLLASLNRPPMSGADLLAALRRHGLPSAARAFAELADL